MDAKKLWLPDIEMFNRYVMARPNPLNHVVYTPKTAEVKWVAMRVTTARFTSVQSRL